MCNYKIAYCFIRVKDIDSGLGVNIFKGNITNPAVAKISGFEFKALKTLL